MRSRGQNVCGYALLREMFWRFQASLLFSTLGPTLCDPPISLLNSQKKIEGVAGITKLVFGGVSFSFCETLPVLAFLLFSICPSLSGVSS